MRPRVVPLCGRTQGSWLTSRKKCSRIPNHREREIRLAGFHMARNPVLYSRIRVLKSLNA